MPPPGSAAGAWDAVASNAGRPRCRRRLPLPTVALLAVGLMGCSASKVGQGRARPQSPRPLAGVWHRVQAGETLVALAQRYRVPIEDIEEINGVDRRSSAPAAGRRLFIPRPARPRRSARRGTVAPVPEPGRRGGAPAPPAAPMVRLSWPVTQGRLSSRFGPRGGRPHEGIDVAAAEGTAIIAAADGTVIYAGATVRGYGNMIIVRHARDLVTVYAHNRRNLVQQGTVVRQGQVIAEVGRTGRTTGAHLHFEVRRGETPLDPLQYVRAPAVGRRENLTQ